MIKVGIECESIEKGESWGVGRIVSQVLWHIASRPELANEFRFYLYFKSRIPSFDYLAAPIFIKKRAGISFFFKSFSLYYYLSLPIRMLFDRLDVAYFPNYMLPIIFKGKSLVTLTEDIHYEIHKGNLPFRYRIAYEIFSNWAAKHATRIQAISESSKKAISVLFKISLNKISTNYLGVDIADGKTIEHIKTPFADTTDFGLCVGQAFPRRHLKDIIEAFEKISSKFPLLKLTVIGRDKYNPPIVETLISFVNSKLGRNAIYYKQYANTNELIYLYRNAKFIIYVSECEAFGLPPIEGLGYGTVPIVADIPVTREIFEDNAFFVQNPITAESIASAMTEAMTNREKRELIISNSSKIIAKFNWEEHTNRFLEILKQTIK